ncbi:MAG: ribosomal-processing cysteine protease Prp [Clostridia bacterium]|nr:ribosomal-processing cysteine protease Prp [Clostridia bacterium]
MIKVEIETKGGRIVKGIISGHAEFAESNDIVCASVSAVSFAILNGIENVLGIPFGYETADGYLYFTMPDDLEPHLADRVSDLLNTLYLYLLELEKQYGKNIRVSKTEV